VSFRIKTAKGPWRWVLKAFGLAAVTMPWRTIHVLPDHEADAGLLRHEIVHIKQIERDGPLTFSARYLFWLLRYGYRDNPYEVEAYAEEPINPKGA